MAKLFPECNHLLIEAGYVYNGLMGAWGDVKIHGYTKGNLYVAISLFGEDIKDLDITCHLGTTMVATSYTKDSLCNNDALFYSNFLEIHDMVLHHDETDIVKAFSEKELNKTLEVLNGNDNT